MTSLVLLDIFFWKRNGPLRSCFFLFWNQPLRKGNKTITQQSKILVFLPKCERREGGGGVLLS